MAAPSAMAANCMPIFRNSRALLLRALLSPLSSSSGITATVATYRNVPAVKGSSVSPQRRLVPHKPACRPEADGDAAEALLLW